MGKLEKKMNPCKCGCQNIKVIRGRSTSRFFLLRYHSIIYCPNNNCNNFVAPIRFGFTERGAFRKAVKEWNKNGWRGIWQP